MSVLSSAGSQAKLSERVYAVLTAYLTPGWTITPPRPVMPLDRRLDPLTHLPRLYAQLRERAE